MNLEEFLKITNVLSAAVEDELVIVNDILKSYQLPLENNISMGLSSIPRGDDNE